MEETKEFSFSKKFISGEAHFKFWSLAARAIGIIGTFMILAEFSPYEYGVFQLLLSVHAFLLGFDSLGGTVVSNDVLRYLGEGKAPMAKKLFYEYQWWRIGLSTIVLLAMLLGAPLLSFKYKPDFIFTIELVALLIFFDTISSVVKSWLKIRFEFKAVATRKLVYKAIQVGVVAYFFFFSHLSVTRIVISMLLASIFGTLSLSPQIIRAFRAWRTIGGYRGSVLWRVFRTHGKWESFRQFFSKLTSRIQPWLIKIFISTEAVGIYNVALAGADIFKSLFPDETVSTLLPRRAHQKEFMRTFFVYGTKFMTIMGICFFLAGALLGPIGLYFFFPEYLPAMPFFWILLLEVVAAPFERLVDSVLIVRREQKFFFYRTFARDLVWFIAVILFLPAVGLWGMAIIEVILPVAVAFVSYRYLLSKDLSFALARRSMFVIEPKDREILKTVWQEVSRAFDAKIKPIKTFFKL